ncbi:acyl-CoA dehydrogenase family protein [Streptomyces hyaluromycini]|uniref:acyl-CoA dehydrogenase family protein n=1 Tax=Streptomyces hyaluromycini TaxID=1377993 RepID=UPI000B5C4C8A|nr:acyl-CoA dehydrogenase family protein [Streptomyces hyaluromycini]
MDTAERDLLEEALRKTMTAAATGASLDTALADLGWTQMLAEAPDTAVPLVFRLLGETGTQAAVLNDVVLRAAGRPVGGTLPLPYAGGTWVVWARDGATEASALDPLLPLRRVGTGEAVPLAAGRRALGWWLLGTGHAMLDLAREHVLERHQFGRPLASFQALRHRLAEAHVALEGAEAALGATDDDTGALLAKAAAGRAALTTARHCQQALGGIGFTAEHPLHRHVKRALVLDGLLGSTRELTREAGALLLRERRTRRLVDL